MANTRSTVKLQQIVNIAKAMGDIEPVLNVAGTSVELPLIIATDVMNAICSVPFPWKWNEIFMPQFVTNSFQQDYAGIYNFNFGGALNIGTTIPGIANLSSVTNLAWLERGIVIDINNLAQPKPFRLIETGRQLPQAMSTFLYSATNNPLFIVNYFPNASLYYGTWGQTQTGGLSIGNNPVAGSIYISPLGPQLSQPSNPITQIQDANGNLLVLTTYGHEGSAAPVLPANSNPGTTVSGTGATTVWTVVDPNGYGFRILPVPTQTGIVWQFNIWGQALPVRFTSLNQTLYPLPDNLEPNFRQLFISQCYRYSPEAKIRAKFKDEWALGMEALVNCRTKEDRELEENIFTPERGVMGGQRGRNEFLGPQWPWSYPVY